MTDESGSGFEGLFRYYDSVVAFLRKLGFDREVARDLAQDVYARVYQHWDDYRGESKWSYLQQVARRLAFNFLRDSHANKRNGITVSEEELLHHAATDVDSPEDALEQKRIATRVRDAVNRLPDSQRECVMLFYFSELSYHEISAIVGIREPALKSRLHTARAALKELLSQDPRNAHNEPRSVGSEAGEDGGSEDV